MPLVPSRISPLACSIGATLVCAAAFAPRLACAARWSIAPRSAITLNAGSFTVSELSGVAFLGRTSGPATAPCSSCGFIAAQDGSKSLVKMNLTFDGVGAITSAVAVGTVTLSSNLDYEGIAVTGQFETSGGDANAQTRVLVSEEDAPGVHDVSLVTGAQVTSVPIPAVYANVRANRGFEALATWSSSAAGFRMATGNEEALTIDGPASGLANSTVVRIQTYNVVGDSNASLNYQLAGQYAYVVDPIHGGSSVTSNTHSGLADFVAMPDSTLIALERSSALTLPGILNRMYEIDFRGATDVGVAAYNGGLAGQSYIPAGKQLIWSGAINGIGANFEGLTVGPQLANGHWVLVGVVDSGNIGTNTIVSFEAAPIVSADFNENGVVDGGDFLAWQRDVRNVTLADARQGDGNRDGRVDGADLAVWQAAFATSATAQTGGVPEPAAGSLGLIAAAVCASARARRMRLSRADVA